jgi:hypothetical protein
VSALRLGLAAVVLAGCGQVRSTAPAPVYALVIVNDSDAPAFWSIEQPTGEMTRFEVQPCSSMSEAIPVGRAWEVEWAATFAVTSGDVLPLDAPFTVVEVRFGAGGQPSVRMPKAAAEMPEAPLDMLCGRH